MQITPDKFGQLSLWSYKFHFLSFHLLSSLFILNWNFFNDMEERLMVTRNVNSYLTMTFFVPYILQTLEFIISNRTLVEEPFHGLGW